MATEKEQIFCQIINGRKEFVLLNYETHEDFLKFIHLLKSKFNAKVISKEELVYLEYCVVCIGGHEIKIVQDDLAGLIFYGNTIDDEASTANLAIALERELRKVNL